MSSLQSLLDMGFPQNRAEIALEKCGQKVEEAMEWMLAHPEDEEMADVASEGASSEPAKKEETQEAKSLKCDECDKLFLNNAEVEFHAAKTGHASFSESTEEKKPLTEEEKQQKLKEIEEIMKKRRLDREKQEKSEAIDREKKRIQMGKDISLIKQQTAEKEMKLLAEQKRKEKLEDKLAREKVKRDIERDRQARREKFNYQNSSQPSVPAPAAAPKPAPAQAVPSKVYDKTRLQIRLPSGAPLIQEFQPKEPLSAVRLWITMNRTDGASPDAPFKLSTTYPMKKFTEEDMEKPLDILGLVPSAVLVVIP